MWLSHPFKFFFLVSILLSVLSGCRDSGSHLPESFSLKDKLAMQQTLRGTWILKKYEDSIDLGLTPKLLEYMLKDFYSVRYNSDTDCLFIGGIGEARITADYDIAWREEKFSVKFTGAPSQIVFTNKETNREDSAQLLIDGTDTVLVIRDSLPVYFVKYDLGKCADISEYHHLINSKFIAGRYYALTDTGRRHHIIFTKCGSVEGVENISPELKGYSGYSLELTDFSIYPDAISFHNLEYKMGNEYYWEVEVDSLKLRSTVIDSKAAPIVLVRAR